MKKHIFLLLLCLFFIHCKTKQILIHELDVGKSDYLMLKKDQAKLDTILKYHQSLENDRVKYRLAKYLDKTYDWEMLYTSFQLEGIMGPHFEFSDSIPANTPSFNDLDSLRTYVDQMEKTIDQIMNNHMNIQITFDDDE